MATTFSEHFSDCKAEVSYGYPHKCADTWEIKTIQIKKVVWHFWEIGINENINSFTLKYATAGCMLLTPRSGFCYLLTKQSWVFPPASHLYAKRSQ